MGFAMAEGKAQAIRVGDVALQRSVEGRSRPMIRVVLDHGGVKIPVRQVARPAERRGGLSRRVLSRKIAAHGVKASALQNGSAVESGGGIPVRGDLNDAADLLAELRGNAAGVDLH